MASWAITTTVTHPDGGTAKLRKLKGRHLREAQMVRQTEMVEAFEQWTKVRDRMQAATGAAITAESEPESDAPEPEVPVNPVDGYDHATLARFAVLELDGAKPEPAAFEDMDDDRLEWLAGEILRFTKPSLFQSKAEREADQKNG